MLPAQAFRLAVRTESLQGTPLPQPQGSANKAKWPAQPSQVCLHPVRMCHGLECYRGLKTPSVAVLSLTFEL